jgi:hypothetical protein
MSVTIRRLVTRLRDRALMRHKVSFRGKGKWHSLRSLWNYKMRSRKARNVAEESRKRNRR